MVFRDTLVVDSLEKATEIGYGMHKRVITLNGELVETSGIMSGGG
jgi:structural maintenance of chromosome 4